MADNSQTETTPPGSVQPAGSAWDFACNWYQENEIGHYLSRQKAGMMDKSDMVPEDIYSKEFRDWLTHQYRLAMTKGIEIGQRRHTQNDQAEPRRRA